MLLLSMPVVTVAGFSGMRRPLAAPVGATVFVSRVGPAAAG
ncbi:hypothetical protein ppKF707_4350 [Metapseudomonas furukawaii]|uniref:Uncharacterized protein n=1 Tax=Metapseudomonas furukawaii TaxID=1149133 RepID=A0AAD1FEL2_METFU|nr:hypothetical protein ppKF707_4350 [Pseudomonas furukawaii]BAU73331.1 hypothetical protein KF707C_16430 [Pseudomonas furukawaii]